MNLIGRLDTVQLEIIMHLANGKQIDEICTDMHRSRSDVNRRIKIARSRCKAKTIAHLCCMAIASGSLVWENETEAMTMNGHAHT
jgi:DNA-binding NarL/FixJ family response regulator